MKEIGGYYSKMSNGFDSVYKPGNLGRREGLDQFDKVYKPENLGKAEGMCGIRSSMGKSFDIGTIAIVGLLLYMSENITNSIVYFVNNVDLTKLIIVLLIFSIVFFLM
jgi:hypothetical protein